MAEKCENSSLFVPKTEKDLKNALHKITIDHLDTGCFDCEPIRIWTDYERLNETHFWSATANHWLSALDQKDGVMQKLKWNFKNSVTIDGNRKLKNFSPSNHACCICVVNIQMKWPLKCLILSLVASLVFAAAGMIFVSHLRTNS